MQNHNRKKQGLVISYFGKSVEVLPDHVAEIGKGEVQCHLRRNQDVPVVGDQVEFEYEQNRTDSGIITKIKPRTSLLERYEKHGKMKPIVANIDVILIVMSPPPVYAENLIDYYLVAAELLKIPAALILNKADLLDKKLMHDIDLRLQVYRQLKYPVMLSSIYQSDGLEELRKFLENKTAVLVGPSGVGKSSIIAKLAGLDTIRIGDVSTKGTGKHTTTATRLYHLQKSGRLIDSPGVREFNLWPVSIEDLQRGFRELALFAGKCKFRDCQHMAEPSCAVQAAVLDGKISRERLANYQVLWKKAKQRTD